MVSHRALEADHEIGDQERVLEIRALGRSVLVRPLDGRSVLRIRLGQHRGTFRAERVDQWCTAGARKRVALRNRPVEISIVKEMRESANQPIR